MRRMEILNKSSICKTVSLMHFSEPLINDCVFSFFKYISILIICRTATNVVIKYKTKTKRTKKKNQTRLLRQGNKEFNITKQAVPRYDK